MWFRVSCEATSRRQTLKTVPSASIYFYACQPNFVNTENFKLIMGATTHWAFVWLFPQTSSSFLLFLKPLVGPWVCSKPRQDDPLLGLAGKRRSIGGNRPRRAPAVPGLAEHWWVLTGQRVLKLMFGYVHWTLGQSFPPHHKHGVKRALLFWSLKEFKQKNNTTLNSATMFCSMFSPFSHQTVLM